MTHDNILDAAIGEKVEFQLICEFCSCLAIPLTAPSLTLSNKIVWSINKYDTHLNTMPPGTTPIPLWYQLHLIAIGRLATSGACG